MVGLNQDMHVIIFKDLSINEKTEVVQNKSSSLMKIILHKTEKLHLFAINI